MITMIITISNYKIKKQIKHKLRNKLQNTVFVFCYLFFDLFYHCIPEDYVPCRRVENRGGLFGV